VPSVRTKAALLLQFATNGVGAIEATDDQDLIETMFDNAPVGDRHWIGELRTWCPQSGQAVDATSGTPSPNWAVCDGRTVNSITTPDLTDLFLRGADVAGANATGGADSHNHTVSSHSHSLPSDTGGGQADIDDHAAHHHNVDPPNTASAPPSNTSFQSVDVGSGGVALLTGPNAHYHNVDIAAFDSDDAGPQSHTQADHTHPIGGSTGSNTAGTDTVDNVPAFYTVVFCMKVA
jgi:hypothetical protein